MKSVHLFFILLLTIGVSCKNAKDKKTIRTISLDSMVQSEGELILDNEMELLYNIYCMDSLLIAFDGWNDTIGKIYSLDNYELIGTFGLRGRGPQELDSPLFFKSQLNHDTVYAGEINAPYLVKICPGSLSVKVIKEEMDQGLWPAINLNRTGGDIYYGNSLPPYNQGLFFRYDKKTQEKTWVEFYPGDNIKGVEKNNDDLLSEVYTNSILINENKQLIVCALKYFNRLLFYDLECNLVRDYALGEKGIEASIDKELNTVSELSTICSADIVSTKDYIYVLWQNNYLPEGEEKSKILIFNWEMDHLITIQTDRMLNYIAATSDGKSVLGVLYDPGTGDSKVYKYKCF